MIYNTKARKEKISLKMNWPYLTTGFFGIILIINMDFSFEEPQEAVEKNIPNSETRLRNFREIADKFHYRFRNHIL